MNQLDRRSGRFHDEDRESKIRWDIHVNPRQKMGSFTTELNQSSIRMDYSMAQDSYWSERGFARTTKGEIDGSKGVGRTMLEKDRRNTVIETANRRYFRSILPIFKGASDIAEFFNWVDSIEDYFEEVQPSKNLKCKLVPYTFETQVNIWWEQLLRTRAENGEAPISSWEEMKLQLLRYCFPPICLNFCPLQSVKAEQEEKNDGDSSKEDECSIGSAEKTECVQADGSIPFRCSTKVPSELYSYKWDELSESKLLHSVGVCKGEHKAERTLGDETQAKRHGITMEEKVQESSMGINSEYGLDELRASNTILSTLITDTKPKKDIKSDEHSREREVGHTKCIVEIPKLSRCRGIFKSFKCPFRIPLSEFRFLTSGFVMVKQKSSIVESGPCVIKVLPKIIENEFQVQGSFHFNNWSIPKLLGKSIKRSSEKLLCAVTKTDTIPAFREFVSFLFDPGGNHQDKVQWLWQLGFLFHNFELKELTSTRRKSIERGELKQRSIWMVVFGPYLAKAYTWAESHWESSRPRVQVNKYEFAKSETLLNGTTQCGKVHSMIETCAKVIAFLFDTCGSMYLSDNLGFAIYFLPYSGSLPGGNVGTKSFSFYDEIHKENTGSLWKLSHVLERKVDRELTFGVSAVSRASLSLCLICTVCQSIATGVHWSYDIVFSHLMNNIIVFPSIECANRLIALVQVITICVIKIGTGNILILLDGNGKRNPLFIGSCVVDSLKRLLGAVQGKKGELMCATSFLFTGSLDPYTFMTNGAGPNVRKDVGILAELIALGMIPGTYRISDWDCNMMLNVKVAKRSVLPLYLWFGVPVDSLVRARRHSAWDERNHSNETTLANNLVFSCEGDDLASFSFHHQFIVWDFTFALKLLGRQVEVFMPLLAFIASRTYVMLFPRILHVILRNMQNLSYDDWELFKLDTEAAYSNSWFDIVGHYVFHNGLLTLRVQFVKEDANVGITISVANCRKTISEVLQWWTAILIIIPFNVFGKGRVIYLGEEARELYIIVFNKQWGYNFNLTRGRVVPWERWTDENNTNMEWKFIMVEIIASYRLQVVTLALFFKLVNGLDPPSDMLMSRRSLKWSLTVRSRTSFIFV